ncbi:MAG TPA: N-acyl homoserine lactonase family protein [Streptosporangiaceae bacterium]|nr:N-acyl homoserine lactonase family protein [Streptosporangiaceae bacterium]
MLEIKRLHLASLTVADGSQWPVHGFVVTHANGAVLVDTGVGGPPDVLADWRVVNRTVADALADIDMSPADIDLVINTHLHFDHCGQNAVFRHAACWVQRAELTRAKVESPELYDWFDFMNARFELLDGDAEVVPGLRVVTTPGHTAGHQSVVVSTGEDTSEVLLIGDAAYTSAQYQDPQHAELPPGQAADLTSWHESITRLHGLAPARVHFCHDTATVHG